MTPPPAASSLAEVAPPSQPKAPVTAAKAAPAPGLPSARRTNRRFRWVLPGVALTLAAAVGIWLYVSKRVVSHADLVPYTVKFGDLHLTVVERGNLEAAENSDVLCKVKAGTKGSTTATTIKWVIDDGSQVKQGQLVAELDDSGLQEQLKTQKITMDQAKAAWIAADENFKITDSQNRSDIRTAEVNLMLARLNLEKYVKGDYEQTKKDILGRMKTAESDLEQYKDRAAWSQRMVKKGYQTQAQAQADVARQQSGEIALAKVQEELRVLEEYTKKLNVTDLENKVSDAEQALERVKTQAKSKEVSAESDRQTKKSVYEQEKARYDEIQDEISKCKLNAPSDGMVVYYVPEQSRFGFGSQQSIVAQGEPVREGQKLMRIPNLAKMLVNTKVHEALVARIRGEEHDGQGRPTYTGQPALVRVDAYPEKVMKAHVKSVATVASQQDFLSADVKLYQTMVAIDEPLQGLKPGMSAEVTIIIDNSINHVLTVPLQAIVGTPAMGEHRKLFVLGARGPEPREVVIGMSNEKMAEVREGLSENEVVVLNPRSLVGDKEKVHQPGADKPQASPTSPEKAGAAKGGPMTGMPAGPGAAPGGMGGPGMGPGMGGPRGMSPGGQGAMPPGGGEGMPRGPGGAEGAPRGAGGGAQMSPQDRAKRQAEMLDRFRKATPEERKQMLEQIPESFRGRAKDMLKKQGVDIPD